MNTEGRLAALLFDDLSHNSYKMAVGVKPNKRGTVLALSGPQQRALARIYIHDDHTVKTTVRNMCKSQIHSNSQSGQHRSTFVMFRTKPQLWQPTVFNNLFL